MKITGEQRNAASLYWSQVLSGALIPQALVARNKGLPSFMVTLESMNRGALLDKLNSENMMWPLVLTAKLEELLNNAEQSLILSLSEHKGPLRQAAKEANIPDGIFPIGDLTMFFDQNNNLIVGGETINAADFLQTALQEMSLGSCN